jgi:hypothetical protein
VKVTNRYARATHNDHNFQTTEAEIRTFVGILILSGYNTLATQHLYWGVSPDIGVELVKHAMPRDRFSSPEAISLL